MRKEIGKRIQNIREDLGMTKESFAKEIGITRQYLGQVERGKSMLSVEKLKLLCDYTDLSADYILFGKNPNLIKETRISLGKLTDKQIKRGCNMLKDLALFISKED